MEAEENEDEEAPRALKQPSLLTALVPMVTLILPIAGSLLIFGLDALDGPTQVALMLSGMCAALVALRLGYRWTVISGAGEDWRRLTCPGWLPTAERSPHPWCRGTPAAAFMGAVLGVPTLLYLPYANFCIANPVLSVIYGVTDFKIKRIEPAKEEVR